MYSLAKITRKVYKEWFEYDDHQNKKKCHTYERTELQHPDAQYVAFAKGPFGEGAERFAFRFFELAADCKTILGKALVAKESRLILEDDNERARKRFTANFCKTQQLACRLAKEFNDKLMASFHVDESTPTITFLDCSLYELDDDKLGTLSVLVEDKLDHTKWQKWNSNNGFVKGMEEVPVYSEENLQQAEMNMIHIAHFDAHIIEEGSEDDSEMSEKEDKSSECVAEPRAKVFTPFEVAQAFSHFTYWASGRKRLVCDLQGVYDEVNNMLVFSDPVIHYHNLGRYSCQRNVHGRTDHGRKGMVRFFDTHAEYCGHLCKIVNRGFQKQQRVHRNKPS